MKANEIITLDITNASLLSFLNDVRESNGMINKRCPYPECGSNHTYAVSSRAKFKLDAEGKPVMDSLGYPDKIMCRHCRGCGKDYFEDQVPVRSPSNLPPEMQRVLKAVQEIRDKKKESA